MARLRLQEIDFLSDEPIEPARPNSKKSGTPKRLEYSHVIGNLFQGSAPPPGPDVGRKFDALVLMATEYQPSKRDFPGVEVYSAPIYDAKPSGHEVQAAYKAAQWVASRLKSGKRVLVTCMAGLNRSGMVSAMALVLTGYPPKNAIAAVKGARGPHALSNGHFANIIRGMRPVTQENIVRMAIRTLLEVAELLPYNACRDYTSAELEVEVAEYFENRATMSTMPDLFQSPEDAREKIGAAPTEHLSESDMLSLQNSDVSAVLSGGGLKAARDVAEQNDKDIDSIIEAMDEADSVPPPIVVRDESGSNYLLGGNTRLMTAVALGKNPLVKVIKYPGNFRLDA